MSSLKVIALISGGKDSLYSILHCLAGGHEIVALANLHPPIPKDGGPSSQEEGEDLNSYMYQTVGHSIIPLYETALGIPLFRQEILGSAVNTERDYSAPASADGARDETESMVVLLNKVKAAIPEANAISTGAILSTYQRTRVESVALRLGLTPLSYLWQYPHLPPYSQSGLLADMAAVGQDARIIKVASGGLDEQFLWLNVADPKTVARLGRAMARFGENGDGAVLGEGGEFETLAVDGPGRLWKKRIEVESDGVVVGEGGNVVFRGKNARVVEKEEREGSGGLDELRIPDMWDDEFKAVLEDVRVSVASSADMEAIQRTPHTHSATLKCGNIASTSSTITISNLSSRGPGSPSQQMEQILQTLNKNLSTYSLTPSHITHVKLLLRSISDFTTLNPIYSTIFTTPNPPSRVTISCGPAMPKDVSVMLSAIVTKPDQTQNDPHFTPSTRKGLHVQSRSYWAPANIGPYSQAISIPLPLSSPPSSSRPHPEAIYPAGQIPLIPSTMAVYNPSDFPGHATLALQHLWRIGRATHVRWWSAGIAYLSSKAAETGVVCAKIEALQRTWRGIHRHYAPRLHFQNADSVSGEQTDDEDEEDEDDEEAHIDPWDMRNLAHPLAQNDTTHRHPLPDPDILPPSRAKITFAPPCFVVQIDQLPREVDVEWHSTGVAVPRSESSSVAVSTPSPWSTIVEGTNAVFVHAEIERAGDMAEKLEELVKGDEGVGEWEHGTVYVSCAVGAGEGNHEGVLAVGEGWKWATGLQWVPCMRVWGAEGREVWGVVVGRVRR